jgi:hypothetical protein
MISLNIYSSLRKMDETKLVRMTHKGCRIYWHTPRHHKKAGVSRNLENHIVNDQYTGQTNRPVQGNSTSKLPLSQGTTSGEVSNIMDITPIWLVSSAVCFVTLWLVLDLIRVSKDTIAKQSGRGGIK